MYNSLFILLMSLVTECPSYRGSPVNAGVFPVGLLPCHEKYTLLAAGNVCVMYGRRVYGYQHATWPDLALIEVFTTRVTAESDSSCSDY